MRKSKRLAKQAGLIIILIVGILVIAASAGYYFYSVYRDAEESSREAVEDCMKGDGSGIGSVTCDV